MELDPIEVTVQHSFTGETIASFSELGSKTFASLAAELESVAPVPRESRYFFMTEDGVEAPLSNVLRDLVVGSSVVLLAGVQLKPWCLSPMPQAKSESIQLLRREEDGDAAKHAKRTSGQGGVVMSQEPIPWVGDRAAFEVVIEENDGPGHEGLEIGITNEGPDRLAVHSGYAVLTRPSWVSSDAGCLWIDGQKQYRQPAWANLKPIGLKAGDMVRFSLLESGFLEVHVNGQTQASWKFEGKVPRDVYALVGLRAPCSAVKVQLPQGE
eukprot:TRINITY_DN32178_c0_g1_i1.p1 TRINITY_DN32178_c0_g1~~TRINITY_DN32178_c0_g1_i1.p1  ORF type:complete len:268 (+),score=49.21 TRINITY_DN32178_c0_g1_i1:18-821(+)